MITFEHKLIDNPYKLAQAMQQVRDEFPHIVAGAFDTETTGLHAVLDTPFLFQCGYYKQDLTGVVFIVDLENTPQIGNKWIRFWNAVVPQMPIYLGHHIVFDLHMLENIGLGLHEYDNLSDTQFFIRAGSDAIQTDRGGEPLGLKDWAVRHISKDANAHEKHLGMLRTQMAKEYNSKLLAATGWKKGKFNDFFKDKLNDYTDLPDDIRQAWENWHSHLPVELQRKVTGTVESDDIQYNWIDREAVVEYGYMDIEYTLMCYYLLDPVVRLRENYTQVQLECAQIPVIFEMERVGFLVDTDYLMASKQRTKQYTLTRRKDLEVLAGEPLSCHQSIRIKQLLEQKFDLRVDSTGADVLELLAGKLKGDGVHDDAVEFIETILELRTLEKWYSTYIRKFDEQLSRSNRIYTSVNQVGAVSGRISCDFQQFPKAGLLTNDGQELFDPRRMVVVNDEYPCIVYLDYSAQELRTQALLTWVCGCPDLNMLRAYCPYQCHLADGTKYNFDVSIDRVYKLTWLKDEDNQPWEPTDLHGFTTKNAFGMDGTEDNFHDMRYHGKRANFLLLYGGSVNCLQAAMPELNREQCENLYNGFYKAYTGVQKYGRLCNQFAANPYTCNLYDVKYYGVDGHKLRNVLIQGTCAYMTKDRMRAVYDYLHAHPSLKSKLVMAIHDEVQLYIHKDDPIELLFELQKIMQETGSPVPIVSDMEVTFTNWKEKQEVSTLKEVKKLYGQNGLRVPRDKRGEILNSAGSDGA